MENKLVKIKQPRMYSTTWAECNDLAMSRRKTGVFILQFHNSITNTQTDMREYDRKATATSRNIGERETKFMNLPCDLDLLQNVMGYTLAHATSYQVSWKLGK